MLADLFLALFTSVFFQPVGNSMNPYVLRRVLRSCWLPRRHPGTHILGLEEEDERSVFWFGIGPRAPRVLALVLTGRGLVSCGAVSPYRTTTARGEEQTTVVVRGVQCSSPRQQIRIPRSTTPSIGLLGFLRSGALTQIQSCKAGTTTCRPTARFELHGSRPRALERQGSRSHAWERMRWVCLFRTTRERKQMRLAFAQGKETCSGGRLPKVSLGSCQRFRDVLDRRTVVGHT